MILRLAVEYRIESERSELNGMGIGQAEEVENDMGNDRRDASARRINCSCLD